jgi:hypothetical protein
VDRSDQKRPLTYSLNLHRIQPLCLYWQGRCEPRNTHISRQDRGDESRRVATLASIRTLLELANNVLDGCQIWGPKAAVGAAVQVVKALQVCPREFINGERDVHSGQTSLENKQAINDVDAVRKIAEALAPPTPPMFTPPIYPELQTRISKHIQ